MELKQEGGNKSMRCLLLLITAEIEPGQARSVRSFCCFCRRPLSSSCIDACTYTYRYLIALYCKSVLVT